MFFFFILGLASMLELGFQVVYGYGSISEAGGTTDGKLALARLILWGLPCSLIFVAGISIEMQAINNVFFKLAHALGNASYSIYLSHLLVFIALQKALIGVPCMHADIVILLALILAALIGWIVYCAVEKPLTQKARTSTSRLIMGRNESVMLSSNGP
jgi:peptidoglycan/LPS O-acetylase OafA/YrhL